MRYAGKQMQMLNNTASQSANSATGKLVLAAIVYHDTNCESLQSSNGSLELSNEYGSCLDGCVVRGEVEACRNDLGDRYEGDASSERIGVQVEKEIAHDAEHREQRGGKNCKTSLLGKLFYSKNKKQQTTTLIDNTQTTNQQSPGDLPPKYDGKFGEQTNDKTEAKEEGGATDQFNGDLDSWVSEQDQVIEFKFDLIVELGNDKFANTNGANVLPREVETTSVSMTASDQANRLNEAINRLLESFVIDSNDVCLMSIGKQSAISSDANEFAYLSRLASHSLVRSFELLQPSSVLSHTNPSPQGPQLISLELSAILIQVDEQQRIRIVDLLRAPETSRSESGHKVNDENGDLDGPSNATGKLTMTTVDCISIKMGLQTMAKINKQLGEEKLGKLLLFSLKLKRRINGGLFCNRMCLIDFDPTFLQLRPIFENIFNGQALAYMKRHKPQVSRLDDFAPNGKPMNLRGHAEEAGDPDLLEAEWLLYKQLSAALIKTLLVVHVHSLSLTAKPTSGGIQGRQQELLTKMAYNLELLEFARSIQRAAASRIKRRKRHLRSHLASSNLSVNSNISTGNTKLTASSPMHRSTMGRKLTATQTTLTNKMTKLTSPSRRQPPDHDDIHRCCAARKFSLDTNLTLSRHQRCHNHNHNHKLSGSWSKQRASRGHGQAYELTESSSMSMSSGSGRLKRSRDCTGNIKLGGAQCRSQLANSSYLSDSDSITSANLNSCSSSSAYNNRRYLATNNCLSNNRQQPSRHRRDIELKWQEKQSRKIRSPDQSSSPAESSLCQSTGVKCRLQQLEQFAISHKQQGQKQYQKVTGVIQIDCPDEDGDGDDDEDEDDDDKTSTLCGKFGPANSVSMTSNSTQRSHSMIDRAEELEGNLTDNDNVSDICSVIAPEPPKQLKLEEFLHQLSNIIAPSNGKQLSPASTSKSGDSQGCLSAILSNNCKLSSNSKVELGNTGHLTVRDAHVNGSSALTSFVNSNAKGDKNNNNNSNNNSLTLDEDDEDCKSHSSILEHLSSLALESNSKLTNRRPEAPHGGSDNLSSPTEWPPPPEPNELDTKGGHLQRICNAQAKETSQLEDQLRSLVVGLANSNNNQRALNKQPLSAVEAESRRPSLGASAGNNIDHRRHPDDPSSDTNQADHLYAIVIRNQQNVKT